MKCNVKEKFLQSVGLLEYYYCINNIRAHCAVVYKNCMYVFGGYGTQFYNDLFELNLGNYSNLIHEL